MEGALDGIRVVDITTVLMAPLATRMLADHGADVIKIEHPAGDAMRAGKPARNAGMPGVVLNLFRNKRSVALDLKHPDGLEAGLRIVDTADVLVTNIRPAGLRRLGLDHEVVLARSPSVVYCSAIGFGENGPYAGRPAYDDVIQAGSGQAWLGSTLHGEPEYAPSLFADKVGALTILQAVLAALVYRARTGLGQHIEVPIFETMVAFNLVEHQRGHTFEPPLGDFGYARLLTPARRPFRTADGWICLLPYNAENWRDLFTFGGRPELADEACTKDQHSSKDDVEALCELVEAVSATKSTAEWMQFCSQRSIAAMPVNDLSQIDEDPHIDRVGLVETAEHPTEGPYRYVRDSVRYSINETGLRRHAPALGKHTSEILAEAGYSAAEIDELISSGAATAGGAG